MSTNEPQQNYHLQIYTWPPFRGVDCGYRHSFHATTDEAIAHLDSQAEPFCYATLSRLVTTRGYFPCRWDGTGIASDEPWPVRRGTNGEHPAYLAFIADKASLIAEIRQRRNGQGGGILDITHAVLGERHPQITGQTEALAREIVGF